MGRDNLFIGNLGEKMAEAYLINNGYKIIDNNVRTSFGEIDMIAYRKHILVFIEVKTRSSDTFGPPQYAVTAKKKKNLIRSIQYYLKKNRIYDIDLRIDVISINLNEEMKLEKLEHIKSAIWLD